MQIILAFSDKKLRSSVRLARWFTRPAANIINVRLCVSICTNIFIEFTKCLWDKFVLFLELVVQSVVCGQTVEWQVFLSQTVFQSSSSFVLYLYSPTLSIPLHLTASLTVTFSFNVFTFFWQVLKTFKSDKFITHLRGDNYSVF